MDVGRGCGAKFDSNPLPALPFPPRRARIIRPLLMYVVLVLVLSFPADLAKIVVDDDDLAARGTNMILWLVHDQTAVV